MYSHKKLSTACKNFLSVWKLMKNLRDCVLCLTDKKKKISSQTHFSVPTIDHPFIRWTLKRNLFISVYSLSVYTIPYLLLLMLIALSFLFLLLCTEALLIVANFHRDVVYQFSWKFENKNNFFFFLRGRRTVKTFLKTHPFVSRKSLIMSIRSDWVKRKKIPSKGAAEGSTYIL